MLAAVISTNNWGHVRRPANFKSVDAIASCRLRGRECHEIQPTSDRTKQKWLIFKLDSFILILPNLANGFDLFSTFVVQCDSQWTGRRGVDWRCRWLPISIVQRDGTIASIDRICYYLYIITWKYFDYFRKFKISMTYWRNRLSPGGRSRSTGRQIRSRRPVKRKFRRRRCVTCRNRKKRLDNWRWDSRKWDPSWGRF